MKQVIDLPGFIEFDGNGADVDPAYVPRGQRTGLRRPGGRDSPPATTPVRPVVVAAASISVPTIVLEHDARRTHPQLVAAAHDINKELGWNIK